MNAILAKATLLFFVLVNHGMIAAAEEKSSDKLPTWSVSPVAAVRLAEEFDGDWFSIRPPKAYTQVELEDTTAYDRAGIKIAAWTKEPGRPMTPTITIMSLPAPDAAKQSDHEIFQGVLDSLTAKWPNAKGSEILEGLWNGRQALRFRFSATADNGDHIEGAVLSYVGGSETFIVSIINTGDTDEDTIELFTLLNSAVSCEQKTSPASAKE